ncbi:MAG: cytochrome C oxidase subunit IV family protein [Halobacteriovoraceae bacterium]|nr:cytochrome C oxidase subunit IV family protein [Halobacteriovoraceae bacterium]
MSTDAHQSHTKEYLIIFAILAFLTVVELFIPAVEGLSKLAKGSALTIIAVGKAFLVGYYYMHLKDEKPWLRFIACIPISAAVYAIVLMLESVYR